MGLLCGLSNTPTSHAPSGSEGVHRRPTPPGNSSETAIATTTTTLMTKSQPTTSSAQQQPQSLSVDNDTRENVVEVEEESATSILQKAFRKYYNSANFDGKEELDSDKIMELLNSNPAKTSPVLTIKRNGGRTGQWQEFIDREQSSVDQLIRDSFAVFCRDLHDNMSPSNGASPFSSATASRYQRRNSSESQNRPHMGSLPRTNRLFPTKSLSNNGGGTLPRTPPKTETSSFMTSSSGCRVPRGIEELEMLYAPMKNLSVPLPNARKYSGNTMPKPHPLIDWRNELQIVEDFERRKSCDDDQASEVCSIIADMPPCPAPVQSHAILEESLGHEIPVAHLPRTPMRRPKFSGLDLGKCAPPLPPRRTSSKLSLFPSSARPSHLNLSRESSSSGAIYANAAVPNRSSLMSTGSSEGSSSSSGASVPSFDPSDAPVTPMTPNSEREIFSWPNFTVWSGSPSPSDEHRSVSQIGEPPDSTAENSSNNTTLSSERYIKMAPRTHGGMFSSANSNGSDRESHYMNILYEALQRQGGSGSVEGAISPYIAMTAAAAMQRKSNNVRHLPNANLDTISAVYAQPDEGHHQSKRHTSRSGKSRTRSSSASSSTSSSSANAKALAQFRELMREVERKRLYRVGLNLFNSKPELGVEFLARKDFLELSPASVAKFLYGTESGLSKEKIGEYLGNLQSPFAMKVLSCFLQEFNFSGQRVDKAMRKLLERVRVPGEAQKIERILEEFGKRYNKCNPSFASKLKSADSIVTLSFAIMLLNTDLYTPNLKVEKRMTVDDFVNNLRGVDSGRDFDAKMLKSIYRGIKKREFVGGIDHTAQVHQLQLALQQGSSGSSGSSDKQKPPFNLSEPHRRLVCLCRLFEVADINARKAPSPGSHQRDILLFNDLLVVTKASVGGKQANHQPVYSYRDSFHLTGLEVTLFHTPVYHYGIQISRKSDGSVLLTLNAGSEHDRYKFVMDLQESIFEMDQMQSAMQDLSR